ncbi:MAG: VOC family protein [Polyangiaceae bacterium]|nr:VOC family protein [Polyangiaceae bacterium]
MSAKPVPFGFTTLTPMLSLNGAAKAIAFYVEAFDAKELEVALDPSGQKVWHAALRVGNAMLFVNDAIPEMGAGPTTSSMWLYVPDTDAAFERAVNAGATPSMQPADMFWGDRMAQVTDPFGQKWTIATHVKDMTKEEMAAAQEAFLAAQKK